MNNKILEMVTQWIRESKDFAVVTDEDIRQPSLVRDSPEDFKQAVLDLAAKMKIEEMKVPLFLFLKMLVYFEERLDSIEQKIEAR